MIDIHTTGAGGGSIAHLDTGGAGQWRGGLGSTREFCLLSDGGASVEGEGHRFKPWGLFGGRDGATARLTLRRAATGKSIALPSKVPLMPTRDGDIFICEGPAGGGFGDGPTASCRARPRLTPRHAIPSGGITLARAFGKSSSQFEFLPSVARSKPLMAVGLLRRAWVSQVVSEPQLAVVG